MSLPREWGSELRDALSRGESAEEVLKRVEKLRSREATGFEAVISEDGTSLAWQNEATTRITDAQVQSQLAEAKQMRDSSRISNESYTLKVMVILELAKPAPITANHTRQLFTDTRWHRCELVPHKCATGGIRYPSLPGKNIGSAMGQWQIMEQLW